MTRLLDRAHRLAASGASAAAMLLYRNILARHPDCADAANNLGVLLRQTGAEAEALRLYRQALASVPDHADASSNLGRALLEAGDAAAAVTPLRRAAQRQPAAERFHTLGRAQQAAGALDDARHSYCAALRLEPLRAESSNNLANVQLAQGDAAGAVALLDAALAAHPGQAELRYNRALALFLLGRWAEAWADYESRWQARGFPSPYRDFGLPRWDGRAIPCATLLLHWEQGLGDTMQFARYVARARARVGRVVLLVQRPLQTLLHGTADMVITDGDTAPRADAQAPLLSLPHLLGGPVPPPLRLRAAAPPRGDGRMRVGLVWAGNPGHTNDRNRSLPPGARDPVLRLPGIDFVNLQLGPRRAEVAGAAFAPQDMAGTAVHVAGLDVLVAVDTSLAHLAGSLGVPVWLLLPHAPDWRWGLRGAETPWYPSMRLFRQSAPGDWVTPVAAIAACLRRLTAR